MQFSLLLVCLLPTVALAAWNPNCITKPVGFGYKTTGGQGGRTVTPKDINELKKYLVSKEKLIINLDKTYDFTNSEGWATSSGCFYRKCGAGFQESLAKAGTCNGRPATKVKYAKAGTTQIVVGSNKSIISKNGKGKITGKGLLIQNAQNVIIRDITISDINPQVIWAGDGLGFNGAQNVWIHKVTFARIGRQHIVAHFKPNKGITVSSCTFDGNSRYATNCDGKHYWTWLILGTHDEITFINNHVINTSGRTPHAGGFATSKSFVHMIGNYMDVNSHTGIEPRQGSVLLVEGNIFKSYENVIKPHVSGGLLAFVSNAKEAAQCVKYFGESCKVNTLQSSKAEGCFDVKALQAFSQLDKTAINGARKAACLL